MRKDLPEYFVWKEMRHRCRNVKHKQWMDYGGRGIKVCDEWQDFNNFIKDMGRRPSALYSIERIDNSKGYYPDNCVWATRVQQQNNRRNNNLITYAGKTMSEAQWTKHVGGSKRLVAKRLQAGWSIDRALTAKVKERV